MLIPERLKRNYDEEKYYIAEPVVKKIDVIEGELEEKHEKINDFLVKKKITKLDLYGKDPFCRVPIKEVNYKLKKDKFEAIGMYRHEAADRNAKKINEKSTKKDIIKNENFFEYEERKKKETIKKEEKEKKKLEEILGVVNPGQNGFGRRVSKIHAMGSIILGIEKIVQNAAPKQEGSSTDRPLDKTFGDSGSPKSRPLKQGYKKGDAIPNLQTINEEFRYKKLPKDQQPVKPKQ